MSEKDVLGATQEMRQSRHYYILNIEGPKTATRGVNESRKISFEIFGRYSKITTKHSEQQT